MKLSAEHERYEVLRQVRRRIHSRIVEKLERSRIDKAIDEVAVFLMEDLALDTPVAETVLLDFTIYFIRENGETAVERERAALPSNADSDERLVLDAMCRPVYGLVEVDKAMAGAGVAVTELRSGAKLFVHDFALGRSAKPRMLSAGTLLCTDGLWSFSGGMVAVPEGTAAALSMVPPPAPQGWRLDMLYGGKAPKGVVRAIQQEQAELDEMLELLEADAPQPPTSKKPKKKTKSARPKRQTAPAEPMDADQLELDVAANIIAMALEEGGDKVTGYV